MFIKKVFPLFYFCIVYFANSQFVKPGKCPNVSGVHNFEAEKVTGTWYGTSHFDNIIDGTLICQKLELTTNNTHLRGDYLSLNITSGKLRPFDVDMKPVDESKEAHYIITIILFDLPLAIDVKFVAVDYDKYILMWSCEETDSDSSRTAWLYTRNKEPGDNVMQEITNFMDEHNLDSSQLLSVDISNCPSYY